MNFSDQDGNNSLNKPRHIRKSRVICHLLRHDPDKAKLKMCSQGWVWVSDLINNFQKHLGKELDFQTLKDVVKSDDKGRYTFSDDEQLIRAEYGHSLGFVDIEYMDADIDDIYWHGAPLSAKNEIERIGLIPGERNYVHLAKDPKMALAVAGRHSSESILIRVKVKKSMNVKKARNGIGLCRSVIPQDIEEILDVKSNGLS